MEKEDNSYGNTLTPEPAAILPSDKIKIVPPKDEGWLVLKGKQDTVIIGSGDDMVVITFKATTNVSLHIKTAANKPICRLHHLSLEKRKELEPYVPKKFNQTETE